jgi:hypothetical protein
MINASEHYQQTYTYDTGNNLTALSRPDVQGVILLFCLVARDV